MKPLSNDWCFHRNRSALLFSIRLMTDTASAAAQRLIDNSLVDAHSLFQIADLSDVDRLITDDGIQDKARHALEKVVWN